MNNFEEEGFTTSAGQQYTLRAINNSSNTGDMCVFQDDPDLGVSNALSLAWFSKRATPKTTVNFKWTIDYNFVWSETGLLVPGVVFDASQTFGANLQTTNKITLTHAGGAYDFINQTKGPQPGILYITEDSTIPLKQASVGIGMSGNGTFVVQAQPNFNLTFTPHPKYFIAFGNFQPGQVLDIGEINNPAEVQFLPGVFSMTAVLNQDNSWTITPTGKANAALIAARKENAEARFGPDIAPFLLTAGNSLSQLTVSKDGQNYFTNKKGNKSGSTITVDSLQHPSHELEAGEIYTIEGKSGKTDFGPVDAMYMRKAGNTYYFEEQ